MASRSLKKFLKDDPQWSPDIMQILTELSTDGARGAVVLGVSLAEGQLKRLLLAQMRAALKKEEEDHLFGPIAPLSSFSSQIKLAYALEVIGPVTRADLDRLRELRNAFAHSRHVISFETPEVIQAISEFHCLKTVPKADARSQFILIIKILVLHLAARRVGKPGVIGMD
jgi:hypothetical protein